MSSDLFAAFGGQSTDHQRRASSDNRQQQQSFSFFDDLNVPNQQTEIPSSASVTGPGTIPLSHSATSNVVDDDFGEFEDAEIEAVDSHASNYESQVGNDFRQLWDLDIGASHHNETQSPSIHWNFRPSAPSQDSQPNSTKRKNSSNSALVTNELSHSEQTKLDQIAPDPNVLFDADLDNDEFGDFEDAEEENHSAYNNNDDFLKSSSPREQPQLKKIISSGIVQGPNPAPSASFSLLDLDDDLPNHGLKNKIGESGRPTSQAHKQLEVSSFAVAKVSDNKSRAATPARDSLHRPKSPVKSEPTDDWQDFDDWELSEPKVKKTDGLVDDSTGPGMLSSLPMNTIKEPFADELPPTNVPPPAVLLSLIPPLFTDAQKKFFRPLASKTPTARSQILSDKKALLFLQGYILLATVAGRIIAGRKLRWKRDNLLSQGMRIGPASSRGTSGMKLTGIDRGEAAKEDRETVDVVRVWREQLGKVRSAVVGANSTASPPVSGIPELQETMAVRTVKESEGGIRAPRQCALCGLKREERVHKVDFLVEDSFGEWWIDQTSMHRGIPHNHPKSAAHC